MKKLILKLAIIFIPLAIIVVATNWVVDPANIFSGDKYVEKIATILATGNNADNIANYNERLLQKHFLQKKQQQKPDVIVMGSSRIMEIGANIYPNKTLYNIGVSHANINDLIALAGLLNDLQIKPKEVLINLDPFLISKAEKGVEEWLTLKEYHQKFTEKNCGNIEINIQHKKEEEDNLLKKYYTLITFDYFKNSLQFLAKGNTKNVANVGKLMPKKYGRLSNGCIVYSNAAQHPDSLLTANVAKATANQGNVLEIDNDKLNLLKCLLKSFENNGVKYSFVMLPFHKDFYTVTNNKQNNVFDKYEAFYTEFAKQNNVAITGSFSAVKCNLYNKDFYDSYHCSGNAIKQIFETNKP